MKAFEYFSAVNSCNGKWQQQQQQSAPKCNCTTRAYAFILSLCEHSVEWDTSVRCHEAFVGAEMEICTMQLDTFMLQHACNIPSIWVYATLRESFVHECCSFVRPFGWRYYVQLQLFSVPLKFFFECEKLKSNIFMLFFYWYGRGGLTYRATIWRYVINMEICLEFLT